MEAVFTSVELDIIGELGAVDIERPVRKLYELYFEDIINYVEYRGGSREDGSDIFQDALMLLINKIRTGDFRKESNLKTFLQGIANNLWLSEQRKRERRKLREESYVSTEDFIENPVTIKLKEKELSGLFEQIGEVCKSILIGVYYENKSMKDLMKEFNFKTDQVLRNRKALCMKKLKELLAGNKELIQLLQTDRIYE